MVCVSAYGCRELTSNSYRFPHLLVSARWVGFDDCNWQRQHWGGEVADWQGSQHWPCLHSERKRLDQHFHHHTRVARLCSQRWERIVRWSLCWHWAADTFFALEAKVDLVSTGPLTLSLHTRPKLTSSARWERIILLTLPPPHICYTWWRDCLVLLQYLVACCNLQDVASSLMRAIDKGNTEALKLLIDKGANIHVIAKVRQNGQTNTYATTDTCDSGTRCFQIARYGMHHSLMLL